MTDRSALDAAVLSASPPGFRSLTEVDSYTRRRRIRSQALRWALTASMVVAVIPLVMIVTQVFINGYGTLSWEFLTQVEFPPRRFGGGYLQGIVGTGYMVGLATIFAVPLGILGAIYLVEYGRGLLPAIIRFFTDVMTGVPSVFVGLFVYAALVRQFRFGTIMGAIGLAIMMLPIIVRSSEEMLRLVPPDQRAASLGLGARKWQTITRIVLPYAAPGLTTGAMLAVARAAGETAVLLLTALGSLQLVTALTGTAQSSITLLIYAGAKQPFDAGKERAWAGALLLLAMVFALTFIARLITARARR
jgi:phosphate transport system permease protein